MNVVLATNMAELATKEELVMTRRFPPGEPSRLMLLIRFWLDMNCAS